MDESYCETPAAPAPATPASTPSAPPADETVPGGPSYAECVLCRKPTEYPESTRGATLCPVCEWQEAGRTACSG
ncbi:hypothetical protein [Streptomyces sp. NBC_01306]|uniref:hypothetical protein n=1 Tax=Streptomyces sp. NBC_01306 TaxID=2903819 RepID=UPI002259A15F|nr:hypothetical protein [Streptomyces sp. NBC_01306]MCX4723038.1 hypothetical protein [Streptomyces sp. NBC_01306]